MNQHIEGAIHRADGEVVKFLLTADGYQQWGVAPSELGQTADLMGALRDAAFGSGFFEEPEEERPGISHTEAQELHGIIGAVIGDLEHDGATLDAAKLERALELVALIVSDTDPE